MLASSATPCRRAAQSVAIAMFLGSAIAVSQTNEQGLELSSAIRQRVVDQTAALLIEHHLSPEVGKACAGHIRTRLAAGAYDGMTDPYQFANALTTDLRSLDDDGHLRVEAAPPDRFSTDGTTHPEEARQQVYERFRRDNFGFRKIEMLDNGVGYLDLRAFAPPEVAGETAVAAMAVLANSDAVIIDLRENGGGSGAMVQLIASYFFAEPKHLISIETRGQELIAQSWTQPYVPGRLMSQTPLFILTSRRTASAAEEFTYDMKHHGRATVIGETTAGGGHTAYITRVADTFNVVIPNGRPIHPVTGTGWERVGVKPNIEVPESQALTRARLEAMKAVRAQSQADKPGSDS